MRKDIERMLGHEFDMSLEDFSPEGFNKALSVTFPMKFENIMGSLLGVPIRILGRVDAFFVEYKIVNKNTEEVTAEFRIDIDEFTGFDTVRDLFRFWKSIFKRCWNEATGANDRIVK